MKNSEPDHANNTIGVGQHLLASLWNLIPGLGFIYLGWIGRGCIYLALALFFYAGAVHFLPLPPQLSVASMPIYGLVFLIGLIDLWRPRFRRVKSSYSLAPRWWWGLILFVATLVFVYGIKLLSEDHRRYLFLRSPTASMRPTIEIDDLLICEVTGPDSLRRGDLVVFRFPGDRRQIWCKRLVALPGEYVLYLGGKVFINGKSHEYEPSDETIEDPLNPENPKQLPVSWELDGENRYRVVKDPYTVKDLQSQLSANQYWVLGDNRAGSMDSREWGAVEKEDLLGKVVLIKRGWLTLISP